MASDLHQLLLSISKDEGDSFTHVTNFSPSKKWFVKSDSYNQFWKEYCSIASKPDVTISLSEKNIEDLMPLILEFKLQFLSSTIDRDDFEGTTESFLIQIVFYAQRIIEEFFIVEPLNLLCFVLEKNSCEDDGDTIVVTFRLHFPYARMDCTHQTRFFIPELCKRLHSANVMSLLKVQPNHSWDKAIDTSFIRRPILMYGSSESPSSGPFIMTHLTGRITDKDLIEGLFSHLELRSVFGPRYHAHVQNKLLSEETFKGVVNYHSLLPLFMSVYYHNVALIPRDESKLRRSSITSPKPLSISERNRTERSDMDILNELLFMLKPERMKNSFFREDIGKAFFNCSGGTMEGLEAWIAYCVGKVQPDPTNECRRVYRKFKRDNYVDWKTAAWYAMQDNPIEFKKWHSEQYKEHYLIAAINQSHTDVARAFYKTYFLEFICVILGDSKVKWYFFDKHRWVKSLQEIRLIQVITSDFICRFETLVAEIGNQSSRITDVNNNPESAQKKKEYQKLISSIGELIQRLNDVSYQKKVIEAAKQFFFDSRYENILDRNKFCTGCDNCILEAGDRQIFARVGKPQDYITMTTRIHYPFEYDKFISRFNEMRQTKYVREWKASEHSENEEDYWIMFCFKYMSQVFCDEDLCHWVWKFKSSGFIHRNCDKQFVNFCNDETSKEVGDNSKSMSKKIDEETWGDYCGTIGKEYLKEGKRSSSGPTPDKMYVRNKIWVFTQETSRDDVYDDGLVKDDTGGDKDGGRGMYSEDYVNYIRTHKMVHVSNRAIKFSNIDKAIMNRMRPVIYSSVWKSNAPESEEEQYAQRIFPKDEFFEEYIPDMAPAFMWILVQYYKIYRQERLPICPTIQAAHDRYFTNNDKFRRFVDECLEPVMIVDSTGTQVRDERYKMSLSGQDSIMELFVRWYRQQFPGEARTIPNSDKVNEELILRMGRKSGSYWLGWRIRSNASSDPTSMFGNTSHQVQQTPTVDFETEFNQVYSALINKKTTIENFCQFISRKKLENKISSDKILQVFYNLLKENFIDPTRFVTVMSQYTSELNPEYANFYNEYAQLVRAQTAQLANQIATMSVN